MQISLESSRDGNDLNQGVAVAEALAAVGHVLAALILADGDFVTEGVADDLNHGLGAGDEGRADLDVGAVGEQQHRQLDGRTDSGFFRTIQGELVALGGAVLTVTVLDDGVHGDS